MTENHSENSSQSNKSKRRDFLNILLGGGFIAWLGASIFSCVQIFRTTKSGRSKGVEC